MTAAETFHSIGGVLLVAGSRVGYHVRLDAAMTRATRLLFCTTGILLRRLGGDLQLPEVSHIIVDEVRGSSPCSVTNSAPCTLAVIRLLLSLQLHLA